MHIDTDAPSALKTQEVPSRADSIFKDGVFGPEFRGKQVGPRTHHPVQRPGLEGALALVIMPAGVAFVLAVRGSECGHGPRVMPGPGASRGKILVSRRRVTLLDSRPCLLISSILRWL